MNATNRRRVVGIDSAPTDGEDCARSCPPFASVTGLGGARGGACGCSYAHSRHSVQIQPIKVATKSGYA
jgi:hypothetical protein